MYRSVLAFYFEEVKRHDFFLHSSVLHEENRKTKPQEIKPFACWPLEPLPPGALTQPLHLPKIRPCAFRFATAPAGGGRHQLRFGPRREDPGMTFRNYSDL